MTSSGASAAENAVKPRKSQNMTTTSARRPSSTLSSPARSTRSATCGARNRLQPRYAFLMLLPERQLGSHLVKAACKALKLVSRLDGNAVVESPGPDPLGAFFKHPYWFGHPVRQCVGKQCGEHCTCREKRCSPPQGCIDRSVGFSERLFDDHGPVGTHNGSRDGGDLTAAYIPARREAGPRGTDSVPYGAERLGRCLFRPTEDEADVGMRNEPTRSIQDEGEAGLSYFYRRDHVPDQLEIDFRNNHADRCSIADNRDRQMWFGASMVAYIAKPDLRRASAGYRRIGRSVGAAFNSIEPDP